MLLIDAGADINIKNDNDELILVKILSIHNPSLLKNVINKIGPTFYSSDKLVDILYKMNILDLKSVKEYCLINHYKTIFMRIIKNIETDAANIQFKPSSIASKTLIYRNYLKTKSFDEVYELLCKNDPLLMKYFGIYDVKSFTKLQ
jgi:hypothetical protein